MGDIREISESESLNDGGSEDSYEYLEDILSDIYSKLSKCATKKEFFKLRNEIKRIESIIQNRGG